MLERGQNKWKHLYCNMEKSDVTQKKKEIETFKLLKEQNGIVRSRALRIIRGSGNKKMHSDYLRVDKINHK